MWRSDTYQGLGAVVLCGFSVECVLSKSGVGSWRLLEQLLAHWTLWFIADSQVSLFLSILFHLRLMSAGNVSGREQLLTGTTVWCFLCLPMHFCIFSELSSFSVCPTDAHWHVCIISVWDRQTADGGEMAWDQLELTPALYCEQTGQALTTDEYELE